MAAQGFRLQLNQAIQIQVEGQAACTCAVVTNFLQDQIVLRFPQLGHIPEEFHQGAPITIRCVDRSGLLTAASSIVELCAPPRPGIVVANPGNFQTTQNRKFFRVEVDFPCSFSLLASENPANKSARDDNARVRDISAAGVRIATHTRLDLGDRLAMKIVPQPEEGKDAQTKAPPPVAASRTATPVRSIAKPALPPVYVAPAKNNAPPKPSQPSEIIEVCGRVVRVSLPPADAEPIILLGVEFQEVNNRLQDRLVNLVFETQRAQCQRR